MSNLFDHWFLQTRNIRQRCFDKFARFFEFADIVAEYFDGDFCGDARQHMTDHVKDRLFDFSLNARKVFHGFVQHINNLFACHTTVGVQRHHVFGRVHAHNMFVVFGSTCFGGK